jgi:hypothetical protein
MHYSYGTQHLFNFSYIISVISYNAMHLFQVLFTVTQCFKIIERFLNINLTIRDGAFLATNTSTYMMHDAFVLFNYNGLDMHGQHAIYVADFTLHTHPTCIANKACICNAFYFLIDDCLRKNISMM